MGSQLPDSCTLPGWLTHSWCASLLISRSIWKEVRGITERTESRQFLKRPDRTDSSSGFQLTVQGKEEDYLKVSRYNKTNLNI